MEPSSGTRSKLDLLEARLGATWTGIRKARQQTQRLRADLANSFRDHGSPDTSLVVFGSVAREEVTSGSDLDWILLVDGQSVPEHKEQEQEIQRILVEGNFIAPGTAVSSAGWSEVTISFTTSEAKTT